jgi:hypothetical protein
MSEAPELPGLSSTRVAQFSLPPAGDQAMNRTKWLQERANQLMVEELESRRFAKS